MQNEGVNVKSPNWFWGCGARGGDSTAAVAGDSVGACTDAMVGDGIDDNDAGGAVGVFRDSFIVKDNLCLCGCKCGVRQPDSEGQSLFV